MSDGQTTYEVPTRNGDDTLNFDVLAGFQTSGNNIVEISCGDMHVKVDLHALEQAVRVMRAGCQR